MKSTISDLWHGNINPIEESSDNKEQIKELRDALVECYNTLWTNLDDGGKCTLDKLRDFHAKLSALETEESFTKGFSLAIKIMTEALAD